MTSFELATICPWTMLLGSNFDFVARATVTRFAAPRGAAGTWPQQPSRRLTPISSMGSTIPYYNLLYYNIYPFGYFSNNHSPFSLGAVSTHQQPRRRGGVPSSKKRKLELQLKSPSRQKNRSRQPYASQNEHALYKYSTIRYHNLLHYTLLYSTLLCSNYSTSTQKKSP